MRQFVDALVNLNPAAGPLNPEQVAAWKQNLQLLVQQGPNAVPAIREFLAKNVDFDFSPSGGKLTIGYATARAAMFDALAQIGGPMASAALSEVLQTTADPREIGFLGQSLDKLDPGLHQGEILDATRQALAMAAAGNLPDRDVAPLFETIRQYAGPAAVADIEANAKDWNYYATIALGQLPDGAGIPSLVHLATDPGSASNSGLKTAALQVLAQVAPQSDDARTALLNQIKANQLTSYDWQLLSPILAGYQMVYQNSAFDNPLNLANPADIRKTHLAFGNQNYAAIPLGAMTEEQIGRQNQLIEQLLNLTTDPAAVQALHQARDMLSHRLPEVVSAARRNG